MSDPHQPPPDPNSPTGPPNGPPHGQPQWDQPQWGQQPWGQPPGQPQWGQPQWGHPGPQYAQPAAQPYVGGAYGPDWIPELGLQLGGTGSRIGAKAVDMVIVFVINIVIGLAGAAALLSASSSWSDGGVYFSTSDDYVAMLAINLVALAADFLYNVVIVARAGGQPGKLMFGLRLARADGAPLDFRTAFIRWSPVLAIGVLSLVPIVSVVALLARFVLLVVNLVLVCSDGRRQSVFDKVAGTYVVVSR